MTRFGSASPAPALDVLVVCTGNFTRSPYIAWELRRRVNEQLAVGSAGTAAVKANSGADPRLLGCLEQEGVGTEALAHHRPRQVTQRLVESATLVMTATRESRGFIDSIAPGTTDRVYTLVELAMLVRAVPPPPGCGMPGLVRHLAAYRIRELLWDPDTDLHDPIGKAPEVYRAMVTSVCSALDLIVPAIVASAGPDRAVRPC